MSTFPTVPTPVPTVADQVALTPSAPPPPPRSRAGARARWLAARTRNAAKHGLLIASVGVVVVIAALLIFVLVPHRVDRALEAQIAALPPQRDTLPLHSELLAARRELTRLDASIAAAAIASRADATTLQPAAAVPDSSARTPMPPAHDSAAIDLQRQLERIRQAPLVESFRALADTRLLHDDGRVRTLIDSIEQLHAEREAYAALSGPDARYASMTTRLTQLGQRLTRLAESTYADALTSAATSTTAGVNASPAGIVADSATGAKLLFVRPPMADSALARARAAAADTVTHKERARQDAAALNADLHHQREALRSRMQLDIPPMAMLLASLVLGLVLGFALVLWRELRRPTVGDEQELESLTRTRVIVHRAASASVRVTRARRRADEEMPAIMQPTDAAWPLLHLTLSSIGDVSRYVEVVAEQPVLAGAVALNLSAVAAHESRATVLVDAVLHRGALRSLLPASVFTAVATTTTATSITTPDASVRSRWDAPRSLAIGRDVFIDIVLPRHMRSPHTKRDPGVSHNAALTADDLQRLAAHHDLAVYVTDHDFGQRMPLETAVVLCVRPGVTTLAWLSHIMQELESHGRRVRAVVLWSADLPLAG